MRRLFPNNSFVPPKMPDPSKDLVRLVIAEAPGEHEAEIGEPLVGGAGNWFNQMLAKAHIPRDGLTITNCIQCRPPDNVFPTDPEARSYISKEDANEAVRYCRRSHLEPLLSSRPWRRLDLLGDKPLRLVAGRDGGIFKWRGSPGEILLPGGGRIPYVATLHPAYIMRDQTMFPVAVNDLLKGLDPPPEHYNPQPSLEDVRAFRYRKFAFDIETNRWTGELLMVGLCAEPTKALTIPYRGAYIPELKRIFREAETLVGHNALQFDLPILRKFDITAREECVVYDTMLLQHLCFPDFPHDLEFVGSQFVNKPAWKDDKSLGLEWYCCRDVDVTLQCFNQLLPMVKSYKLLDLYLNVQVPLARICRLMHETGFKINPNQILNVREKLLKERDDEEKYLPDFLRTREVQVNRRREAPPGTLGKSGKPVKYVLVPTTEKEIPWRSPAIKARYLYSKEEGCLGLEEITDQKSGNVTTGKIALDKLTHRLVKAGKPKEARTLKAIRRLNQLDELITTFAKADMVKIDRMFPHFNVHGTNGGRLSSSDPNFQNIPETARFIYVPSHEGWKIVDVDYSQIENRLTAYFAGDKARLERFRADPKFSEHRYAASLFLGVPYDEVVKDNDKDAPYGKAKRIVHMTNYGGGYKKIANMYDMDLVETRDLQEKWKKEIWPTITWQQRTADLAKKQGYLRTPFSRMRWFWTSSYYTESLSFLPQSTAADIIFRAMIGLMYERIGWPEEKVRRVVKIYKALPKPARLLIQVHDSLVFECPAEQVDELIAVVREVMEQPWPELGGFHIPIGIKVGDSWGEADDYEGHDQTRSLEYTV